MTRVHKPDPTMNQSWTLSYRETAVESKSRESNARLDEGTGDRAICEGVRGNSNRAVRIAPACSANVEGAAPRPSCVIQLSSAKQHILQIPSNSLTHEILDGLKRSPEFIETHFLILITVVCLRARSKL